MTETGGGRGAVAELERRAPETEPIADHEVRLGHEVECRLGETAVLDMAEMRDKYRSSKAFREEYQNSRYQNSAGVMVENSAGEQSYQFVYDLDDPYLRDRQKMMDRLKDGKDASLWEISDEVIDEVGKEDGDIVAMVYDSANRSMHAIRRGESQENFVNGISYHIEENAELTIEIIPEDPPHNRIEVAYDMVPNPKRKAEEAPEEPDAGEEGPPPPPESGSEERGAEAVKGEEEVPEEPAQEASAGGSDSEKVASKTGEEPGGGSTEASADPQARGTVESSRTGDSSRYRPVEEWVDPLLDGRYEDEYYQVPQRPPRAPQAEKKSRSIEELKLQIETEVVAQADTAMLWTSDGMANNLPWKPNEAINELDYDKLDNWLKNVTASVEMWTNARGSHEFYGLPSLFMYASGEVTSDGKVMCCYSFPVKWGEGARYLTSAVIMPLEAAQTLQGLIKENSYSAELYYHEVFEGLKDEDIGRALPHRVKFMDEAAYDELRIAEAENKDKRYAYHKANEELRTVQLESAAIKEPRRWASKSRKEQYEEDRRKASEKLEAATQRFEAAERARNEATGKRDELKRDSFDNADELTLAFF